MAASGLRTLFVLPDRVAGKGRVRYAWNGAGTHLAVAGRGGTNDVVHMYDRHGGLICDVLLEGSAPCLSLEWDKDGECVVILRAGLDRVAIWDVSSRSVMYIDTGLKDVTFAKWSKVGPHLVLGSASGGVLIFRRDTRKKFMLPNKHTRAIVCGDWSSDNKVALCSADAVLSVSTAEGSTVQHIALKHLPLSVQFATEKSDGGFSPGSGAHDTTVSINMDGRTILMYNLERPDDPAELVFQERYGKIAAYTWFGDGYIMLGFTNGFAVVISTHRDEVKEEIFSGQFFSDPIVDVACNVPAQRAATAGGNMIKLLDMHSWREVRGEFASVNPAHGTIDSLAWTADGQILTATTSGGYLYAFLGRLPALLDSWKSRVAHLTSLREMSVLDIRDEAAPTLSVELPVEPSFLAVGDVMVAAGMNNRVWYYTAQAAPAAAARGRGGADVQLVLVNQVDYVGTVDDVRLHGRVAAALSDGQVFIQTVTSASEAAAGAGAGAAPAPPIILPEHDSLGRITCTAVAGQYLFYGTSAGSVEMFDLAARRSMPSCTFRGDAITLPDGSRKSIKGVKFLAPNALGTRVVIVATDGTGWLYNPLDGRSLELPSFPPTATRVVWDQTDRAVFCACAPGSAAAYVYTASSMAGPTVSALGKMVIQPSGDMFMESRSTRLPPNYVPLLLTAGVLSCFTGSGSMSSLTLDTHAPLTSNYDASMDLARDAFAQALALQRLNFAWDLACILQERHCWMALTGKAMELLDVDVTMRAYRLLGDAGMVAALEPASRMEDAAAAAGYMAMMFNDATQAQELLLASSQPRLALDMRIDLMQWDAALKLAGTLAPEQVPFISVEYAKQLESKGDIPAALDMYTSAQSALAATPALPPSGRTAAELRVAIVGGIARCTLQQGDLRRGIQMALDSGEKQICRDCAVVLESKKQFSDAAALYKQAEMWDKAAALFMASKNYAAVEPLMPHITTPKLLASYAKACEATKNYTEAAKAYERARDMDAVVRLYIGPLDMPERAAAIVRATRSAEGAALVAKFCEQGGDFRGAIEFLLLAHRRDDAFQLACKHGEMALYVQALRIALAAAAAGVDASSLMSAAAEGSSAVSSSLSDTQLPVDECNRIALYYEAMNDRPASARMWMECGQYMKAIKLYLDCGEAYIEQAIEVVGKARDESVTNILVDYLNGELDGVPKEERFVYKVYAALGKYNEMAATATVIAEREQEMGNYKVAHHLLFDAYRDLEMRNIRVPRRLRAALALLHSYLLVKKLVRLENHEAAAMMMRRVANNVSRFPSHVVPILTSTVIECQRAGMRVSAHEFASTLMGPDYRDMVEPKFRKKIEALVRRQAEDEAATAVTPCPLCDTNLPAYDLDCTNCRAYLPYCIVTGKHMTIDDCSSCPHCNFPAAYSELATLLAVEPACPMCGETILPATLQLVRDPGVYLRKIAGEEAAAAAAAGDEASSK